MNKWVTLSIINVLLIGVIATGVLYAQKNTSLKEAQGDIAGLEGNVSVLEDDVSTLEGDVSTLEGNVSSLEDDVSTLETDLVAAEGEVSTLGTDLAAAEGEVSALGTDLAAAEGEVSTLETNLVAAEAKVSTAETELNEIKDPRHFESLEELEAWLEQDDTDTKIRWASMSPFERAFVLQVRALRDGYLLPANFEDPDFDLIVDFVGNIAYIGDELYYVWAADDSIFPFAGEMLLLPSHPLPLD